MNDLRTAAQQALERLRKYHHGNGFVEDAECIAALEDALAQQAEPQGCATEEDCTKQPWCRIRGECQRKQEELGAYGYASRLAFAIWKKHYKDTVPQWKPIDDLMGVLTQIDNMTSGLTRLTQQAEPRNQCGETCERAKLCATCAQVLAQQAEPVREPVAWLAPRTVDSYSRPDLGYETCSKTDYGAFAVYAAPPQRLPLTEEEIDALIYPVVMADLSDEMTDYEIARAVERAHGIKERV